MSDPTQPYVWIPGDSLDPERMWKWLPADVERSKSLSYEEVLPLVRQCVAVKWMEPEPARAWVASLGLAPYQQLAVLRSAGTELTTSSGHTSAPAPMTQNWNELSTRRAALWLAGGSMSRIAKLEGVSEPSVVTAVSRVLPVPRIKIRTQCSWEELSFMRSWFMRYVDTFRYRQPEDIALELIRLAQANVEQEDEPLGDYGNP